MKVEINLIFLSFFLVGATVLLIVIHLLDYELNKDRVTELFSLRQRFMDRGYLIRDDPTDTFLRT